MKQNIYWFRLWFWFSIVCILVFVLVNGVFSRFACFVFGLAPHHCSKEWRYPYKIGDHFRLIYA